MKRKSFFRTHLYGCLFSAGLTLLSAFVLLDTFLLPHAISTAEDKTATVELEAAAATETVAETTAQTQDETAAQTQSEEEQEAAEETPTPAVETPTPTAETVEPVLTDTSYESANVQIEITTLRVSDTDVYVADIQLASADLLKTALAQGTFGTNVTETTSSIAAENDAIFAINGDYYGANKRGYVIKNGVLYRDSVRQDASSGDLVIYADGSFGIIDENDVSAEDLIDSGVWQLLAFGPVLVENGTIAVSTGDEVDRSMTSNPRTAIGIVEPLHYIIVVSDGRTKQSDGLTLYELAQVMQQYGCTTAYNLDGGGSSTMVFAGEVVNNPTTSGKKIAERAVSDIVYVGAE